MGRRSRPCRRPSPTVEPAKLIESTIELPVQVNGKLRGKITVPADVDEATALSTAEADPSVKPWVDGKAVKKRIYVPRKLVSFVVTG